MLQFKIRASSCSLIMANNGSITDKQLVLLSDLEEKDRTVKQDATLKDLIKKRDSKPELPQGAKTYCKKWLKEQLYKRRVEFRSKYTDKGILSEDVGFDIIAKHLNLGLLFQNEKQFENDFMTGKPDAIVQYVIDQKNSWSFDTFPILESKIPDNAYFWQGQVYMKLTDLGHFKLVYLLQNTPEHLILKAAKSYCWDMGYDELPTHIYQEFHDKMTYDNIPDNLKIKIFEFDRDEQAIEAIENRVVECRTYIETLINSINLKN